MTPDHLFFRLTGIFLLGFLVTSLLTPLFIRLASRVGALDKPATRKIHTEPRPLLGGVAIFAGYSVCFFMVRTMFMQPDSPLHTPFLGLYLTSGFLLAVGIVDDLRGMAATTKLAWQVAAALVMIYLGVRIRFWIDTDWLQALLTLAWFVIITNAFNLLDNMDGLSGGVGSLIAFVYFLLTIYAGQNDFAFILLGLSASIIGFLKYNFYPSRIFMGDAGSLFIGFNLAAVSAMVTYVGYGPAQRLPIVTPLIIFSVPLYDTASVIFIRLTSGVSIFQADKRHFSHRLVALGMTQRQAVFVILLLTLAVGLMAVLLPKLTGAQGILVLLHTAIIFLVIALLERSGGNKLRSLEQNGDEPGGRHPQ
ncbi:undecaprenyl/decaprenyl-phosphate alpha-N-acetylglucosaminyl 1-phosphate transferase [bacterium]|nr:undecaprenyl/decaprenyl-phosphate alpha-N-acetylglucosaminyl 1-phosphate transferase [bacterium]